MHLPLDGLTDHATVPEIQNQLAVCTMSDLKIKFVCTVVRQGSKIFEQLILLGIYCLSVSSFFFLGRSSLRR